MIIGITGKAGHGKDSLADILLLILEGERVEGVSPRAGKYSMASPVKEVAKYVFGLTDWDVNTQEGKLGKPSQCYGFTTREILQLVGTESFRNIFSMSVWTDFAQRYYENILKECESAGVEPILIVPDIRFDNEASWVRNNGGFVVQVVRPGFGDITNGTHSSENGLTEEPDYVVYNSGTKEDLYEAALDVIVALSIETQEPSDTTTQ